MSHVSPRYILQIAVLVNGTIKDTKYQFSVPTSQPMPVVGDEVEIPKEILEAHGITANALRIVSRRFRLYQLEIGITGFVFLICEPLGKQSVD